MAGDLNKLSHTKAMRNYDYEVRPIWRSRYPLRLRAAAIWKPRRALVTLLDGVMRVYQQQDAPGVY